MSGPRITHNAVFSTLEYLAKKQTKEADSKANYLISNIIFADGTPAIPEEKAKFQGFYELKRKVQ